MADRVNMIKPTGEIVSVPADQVQERLRWRWELEAPEAALERQERQAVREAPGAQLIAGVEGINRGVFGPIFDAYARGAGFAKEARLRAEEFPTTSAITETAGAVLPALATGGESAAAKTLASTPAGLIGRAEIAAAESAEASMTAGGATGLAARAAPTLAAGAVGGALQGASVGASKALQQDELTAESLAASVGSASLTGALTGLATGAVLHGVVEGSQAAARAVRRGASAQHLTSPEAITAERQVLASEITSIHEDLRGAKWPGIAAKGVDDSQAGKILVSSANTLRKMSVNKPQYFAEKPDIAKGALEELETALSRINTKGEGLRAKLAAEGGEGTATWGSLENTRIQLERVQAARARLKAIGVAEAELNNTKKGVARRVVEAGAGYGTYAVLAPVAGPLAPVAGLLAHEAAGAVIGRLARRMSSTQRAFSGRIASALDSFATATAATKKVLPAGAARVLAGISYAPPQKDSEFETPTLPARDKAVTHYRAREKELRSLVEPGVDGRFHMTLPARKAVYDKLEGVRHVNAFIADRMESAAVRKVEFLANRLPKRPGPPPIGPDNWQPSAFAVGQFARYASAVEDPAGVLERLASSTITPEDVEALREVYPGTFASVVMDVARRIGELRKTLPFSKRLSLSILTGQPVDMAMDPAIIALLQANHETDSSGGGQQPPPSPRSGKAMSPPEPTDAQRRAG